MHKRGSWEILIVAGASYVVIKLLDGYMNRVGQIVADKHFELGEPDECNVASDNTPVIPVGITDLLDISNSGPSVYQFARNCDALSKEIDNNGLKQVVINLAIERKGSVYITKYTSSQQKTQVDAAIFPDKTISDQIRDKLLEL